MPVRTPLSWWSTKFLRAVGESSWRAELLCREEFDDDQWQWALRRYWAALGDTHGRWTMAAPTCS